MKELKRILFLVTVLFLTLSACKKEEIVDTTDKTPPTPTETTSNPLVSRLGTTTNEGINLGCFTIDFTFNLVVDGTTVEIASDEDFENAISAAGADSSAVDFEYPFNITYEDGQTATIANAEELGAAFASCVPDTGWVDPGFPAYVINDSCYTLVYPISVQNEAGETFTAENEDALISLIATGEYYTFVFPISLTDVAGTVYEAADEDGLMAILLACDYGGNPNDSIFIGGIGMLGCYDLVFPVNYVDAAGNVATAANADEYIALLFSNSITDFSFPLTIVKGDNDPITVNSAEELGTALAECDGGFPINDYDLGLLLSFSAMPDSTGNLSGCYTINYPINVLHGDTVISLEDDIACYEELSNDINADIQYPVSVQLVADDQTVILENSGDLSTLIDDCN